jgi:hypothetical protein
MRKRALSGSAPQRGVQEQAITQPGHGSGFGFNDVLGGTLKSDGRPLTPRQAYHTGGKLRGVRCGANQGFSPTATAYNKLDRLANYRQPTDASQNCGNRAVVRVGVGLALPWARQASPLRRPIDPQSRDYTPSRHLQESFSRLNGFESDAAATGCSLAAFYNPLALAASHSASISASDMLSSGWFCATARRST